MTLNDFEVLTLDFVDFFAFYAARSISAVNYWRYTRTTCV